ncbi:hypothetical protein F383_32331 [Gossypium arboreum]|uniref:Uncharacterized protein n=1 Tax=Gossypium arboreum TaxID=29729 RepID=A0A0B0MZG6_GOSAR|nr:hypothetical protein F383_32331 [Gossypium arboreum]
MWLDLNIERQLILVDKPKHILRLTRNEQID